MLFSRITIFLIICLFYNQSFSQKTSFSFGPSIYSGSIDNGFPSPYYINASYAFDEQLNGEISLYYSQFSRTRGTFCIDNIEGTCDLIDFNNNGELQSILDTNIGLTRDQAIRGLNTNWFNILLVYQSNLLDKEDRRFKIKPFAGVQYFKRRTQPFLTTSYPISTHILGMTLGATLQYKLVSIDKLSIILKSPLNFLLIGVDINNISNPFIPPRLQTQSRFHISTISKTDIPILIGLEYSLQSKRYGRKKRRR